MKSSAMLLALLLAASPSVFADEHGKKGEKREDEKGKIEQKVKVEREDENAVKVKRHVTVIRQPSVVVPNVAVKQVHGAKAKRLVRINNDVNRLESILATAENAPATLSRPSLLQVANEANMLANRIWANVHSSLRGRSDAVNAAAQLRMHIREMHKAAASGSASGVSMHAREALPFAVRIDEIV